MPAALHHVEVWTTDLAAAGPGWDWLLTCLGWREAAPWPQGRSWAHPDGTYVVLEQSPAVKDAPHDRMRAGVNHLALTCADVALLDELRARAGDHGWRELFGDRYPHAGGPSHTALFLEDGQGFEVELVAP